MSIAGEDKTIIGNVDVVKLVDKVSIKLGSEPIEEFLESQNVIIYHPYLEITNSEGEVRREGVSGLGICTLFNYKGDGGLSPSLPYEYNENETAKYFVYPNGKVRQLPKEGSDLKTIKYANCQRQ